MSDGLSDWLSGFYWKIDDPTDKIDIDETWLEKLKKDSQEYDKEKHKRGCECGAWATGSNYNLHARWCPKFQSWK